jgi:hypothetical protein
MISTRKMILAMGCLLLFGQAIIMMGTFSNQALLKSFLSDLQISDPEPECDCQLTREDKDVNHG